MMGSGLGRLEKIQDREDQESEPCTTEHTPFGSRQVSVQPPTEIPEGSDRDDVEVGLLETAICTVVSECNFSVSVADPCSLDSDLIAVSEGFVKTTGYQREEVIGENCRFLNEACPMPPEQRLKLKLSAETGAPFVAVLINRRKGGEPFLNLVDIRGLVIARNQVTKTDIWVAIAVQMDITRMERNKLPENHFMIHTQVANRIRKRLLKNVSQLGLGGTLFQFKLQSASAGAPCTSFVGAASQDPGGSWCLMSDTTWRSGGSIPAGAVHRCLDELPDLKEVQMSRAKIIGLSNRVRTMEDLAELCTSEGVEKKVEVEEEEAKEDEQSSSDEDEATARQHCEAAEAAAARSLPVSGSSAGPAARRSRRLSATQQSLLMGGVVWTVVTAVALRRSLSRT